MRAVTLAVAFALALACARQAEKPAQTDPDDSVSNVAEASNVPSGSIVNLTNCLLNNLANGNVSLRNCKMTVVVVPTPVPTASPSPSPTIAPTPTPSPTVAPTPTPPAGGTFPQTARWASDYASWGMVHCTKGAQAGDAGLGATYYDSIKNYGDAQVYFKDAAKWQPCVDASLKGYRDNYVERSDVRGAVPGYWNFTAGLKRHFDKTGDAKSKQAVLDLASRAAYCSDLTPTEWFQQADLAREVGYCINARTEAHQLGAVKTAYYDALIAAAKKHLSDWFVTKTYRVCGGATTCEFDGPPGAKGQYYVQPFMVAIESVALLRHRIATGDDSVKEPVRIALEWLWANAWVPAGKGMWYENYGPDAEHLMANQPAAPDLNQLIAVAFYKYYQASGDASFLSRADAIFEGGVLGAYIEQPKQFNQNYEWSIDIVADRAAPPNLRVAVPARIGGTLRLTPGPAIRSKPSTKRLPEGK